MTGFDELLEFLMILLITGCAIGWIIIGIGILKCRIGGRCPKGRICKNSGCCWGTWCVKYQRYYDKVKYLSEILREIKEREKTKKRKRAKKS